MGGAQLRIDRSGLEESADLGAMKWRVQLTPSSRGVALLPWRWMYTAGFPKKKLFTPIPTGALDGFVEVAGVRHEIAGWRGLHGHNWGTEHAHRYAYGNAAFSDGAYVDGFTARIKLGPVLSPWLSCLVVRLPDGRELRFDHPLRWISGSPSVQPTRWALDLRGPGGTRATLEASCSAEDMVGLVYRYPDGRTGYCLNTKFARLALRVLQRRQTLYEGTTDSAELETFGPAAVGGFEFHRLALP